MFFTFLALIIASTFLESSIIASSANQLFPLFSPRMLVETHLTPCQHWEAPIKCHSFYSFWNLHLLIQEAHNLELYHIFLRELLTYRRKHAISSKERLQTFYTQNSICPDQQEAFESMILMIKFERDWRQHLILLEWLVLWKLFLHQLLNHQLRKPALKARKMLQTISQNNINWLVILQHQQRLSVQPRGQN